MIEILNMSLSYGSKAVLSELSFDIAGQSAFGIMGKNGAGKTSLIKAVLGDVPFTGKINFPQRYLDDKGLLSRERVYFSGDSPHIYEYLSGLEFIQFILRIKKCPDVGESKIIEFMGLFGIEPETLGSLMKTYSFGMRRKVVLTAGFLSKPELMILDEPTIGLDVPSVIFLKKIISELRKQGMTFLISSHEPSLTKDLCDSLVVLHDSKAVYYSKNLAGETRELGDLYMDLIGVDLDQKVADVISRFPAEA